MPATATRDVAADHHRATQTLADATAYVAGQMWSEVDPDRIVTSWTQQLPELTAVVSGAQLGAARQADSYVSETLDVQDLSDEAASPVNPAGFSGQASDGRGLMSLLMNPTVVTLLTIADGVDILRAMQFGRQNLDMLVKTQVSDAARLADQTSLTAHRSVNGYIRQTDGNPCKRCLILAGRRYQWNQGFQRHPRCGCTHVPAGPSLNPLDPKAIYDRMSPAQRIRAGFTEAEMRALDAGADIFQVVNANRGVYTASGRRFTREGTTRLGLAGQRLGRGRPRLTVDQIFADADSREHALDLLHRNGYLLMFSRSSRTLASAGDGAAVRRILADADSAEQVSRVLADELKRVTGRDIRVDLQGSVATAREHAEGVLRVAERYPDVAIREVVTDRLLLAYAEWDHGRLIFSTRYSSLDRRRRYLEELAGDADAKWHPYSDPVGMAVHEMGHALDVGTLNRSIRTRLDEMMSAADAARVSGYAAQNVDEFVAEAFADVLMNGPRANVLSRQVVELLDDAYRTRGVGGSGTLRTIPDVSRMTVPQLKELAKVRGIPGYVRMRKPELLEALGAPPAPVKVAKKAAAKKVAPAAVRWDRVPRGPEVLDVPPVSIVGRGRGRVTATERRIVDRYRSAGAEAVNGRLRSGLPHGTIGESISALDRVLARSPLPKDVVLERGLFRGRDVFGEAWSRPLAVGSEWVEPGFMSTTASKRLAAAMAGDPPTGGRLVVRTPAGTRAVQLSDATHESEILLERGLRYRVISDTGPGADRVIEVEIIPAVPAKAAKKAAASRVAPTEGTAALDAAPIKTAAFENAAGEFETIILNPPAGWSSDKIEAVREALNGYNLESGDLASWTVRANPDSPGVRLVDQLFVHSELDRPVVVWRGIRGPSRIFGPDDGSLVGRVAVDPGYVSTSVDRDVALGFARANAGGVGREPAVMRMEVPAGVRGIHFGGFLDVGDDPNLELLLERGLRLEVTGDRLVDGVRVLDVVVRPSDRALAPAATKAAKKAAAPAKAAKRVPAKAAGARAQGKELFREADPETIARRIDRGPVPDGQPDATLAAIAREQGFNDRPLVVTSEEFDRFAAEFASRRGLRGQLVYRGVRPTADRAAEAIHRQLAAGAYDPRGGIWGAGIHTSPRLAEATSYAMSAPGGVVGRYLIRPTAVGVDYRSLEQIHKSFLASLDPDSVARRVFADPGRYAAARGYDYIATPNGPVVLNRTVLIADRTPYRPGELAQVDAPAKKAVPRAAKAAPAKKAAKAATPPAPQRMSIAALKTELERAGVTVPPRIAKPALVDEVTALRGGASVDEIGARLNPPPDFETRVSAAEKGQTAVRRVPARMKGAAEDARLRGKVPPASTREGFERLGSYRAFGYTTINKRNRGLPDDWESYAPEFATELDARIASIDALMDRTAITADILVYRGAGTGRGIFGDRLKHDLTGFSWREHSYMSTSLSQRLAGEFAGDPSSDATVGVLMRMVLPNGTKAVYLGEFEGELLTQRGLTLRVVRDHGEMQVEAGRVGRVVRKRVRMLDVEVVPG